MPRLQDAVPGDPQRTWQRHPNPVLIDPLHLAPESTLDEFSKLAVGDRRGINPKIIDGDAMDRSLPSPCGTCRPGLKTVSECASAVESSASSMAPLPIKRSTAPEHLQKSISYNLATTGAAV